MTLSDYLSAHPKTHLVFDMDETIFWLDMRWGEFAKAVDTHLRVIDSSLADRYLSGELSLSRMCNEYIRTYGADAKAVINRESKRFEETSLDRFVPNPHMVEFLREHGGTYTNYIWTSNTRHVAQRALDSHDLSHLFTGIVSQIEVTLLKPEPDGFHLIHDPKVGKEQYLMIGNSLADKHAARAAGIDFYHTDYFTKLPQED